LVKQFRIYRKLKYLTFNFDLSPWGQGQEILFFIYLYMVINYTVQFLTKINQAVQDLLQN